MVSRDVRDVEIAGSNPVTSTKTVFLTVFSFFWSKCGVTSLILNAKGNPIGEVLMVIFSLLCGLPC